jgi:hypothetical protein
MHKMQHKAASVKPVTAADNSQHMRYVNEKGIHHSISKGQRRAKMTLSLVEPNYTKHLYY